MKTEQLLLVLGAAYLLFFRRPVVGPPIMGTGSQIAGGGSGAPANTGQGSVGGTFFAGPQSSGDAAGGGPPPSSSGSVWDKITLGDVGQVIGDIGRSIGIG